MFWVLKQFAMARDCFLFKRDISAENKKASNKVNVVTFMTALWHILLSLIIDLRTWMATSRSTYCRIIIIDLFQFGLW